MFKEFKEFLLKTNALALAVGVILGGAVGKVVSSIVDQILMPIIGLMIPGGDWREYKIALTHKQDGSIASGIGLGAFAGAVIDFVIIAFVIFMITKQLLKPAPAAPTKACKECTEAIPVAAKKCKFCCSPA